MIWKESLKDLLLHSTKELKKHLKVIFTQKNAVRLDKNMKKLLKAQTRIIKKLRQKQCLRVLFLVSENSKWKAQSLYELMEKSDRFEPVIALTQLTGVHNGEDITRDELDFNFNFFKDKGMKVIKTYENNQYLDLNAFNADIVFYQQPWDISPMQSYDKVYKNSLLCYIPYHSPNYGIKKLETDMIFFKYLYRYYVVNNEYKNIYSSWSSLTNLSDVGHTMLDQFLENQDRNNKAKEQYVIYAPHYSITTDKTKNPVNYSTFLENGELILEYAKKHPEIKWVFKPHPQLKYFLLKIWNKEEVDRYYNEWKKIAKCCYDSSYIDLFFDSKALITDCASFLTEYFCTKKPIIHLISENCQMQPVAPFKKIINTFYKAHNNDELMAAIDRVVLQNDDYKKEERLKALDESKFLEGNAAKNIIDDLEKSIFG